MNTLVLSRWKEDVSWTQFLPAGWDLNVVQKGLACPDMGKEAGGYLHWIIKNWPSVGGTGTVGFLQAWPFDHVPHLDLHPVEEFTPLGELASTVNEEGVVHTADPFDLPRIWEDLLDEPFPGHPIEFPKGACFLVPSDVIRKRTLGTYQRLYDYVMQTPEHHSHVLERMWPGIFGAAHQHEEERT